MLAMKIQAVVVSNPSEGTATLEWREWLGEEHKVEEVVIPNHGQVLASTVRPLAEFHARSGVLTITSYVAQWLPRPPGEVVRRNYVQQRDPGDEMPE